MRKILTVIFLFVSITVLAEDFTISPVSSDIQKRMRQGGSYPAACSIPFSDLRYLRILHYNYQGKVCKGEIVCNKAIAQDLIDIFRELYHHHYQIERVQLIDNYGADDERSMRANNTSAFCYRTVAGKKVLSKHSRGMAIDINTQDNPYVKRDANGKIIKLQPNTQHARQYAERTPHKAHQIDQDDLCYKLFMQHGFKWGGDWKYSKDYQHFEK